MGRNHNRVNAALLEAARRASILQTAKKETFPGHLNMAPGAPGSTPGETRKERSRHLGHPAFLLSWRMVRPERFELPTFWFVARVHHFYPH
jgi:hypothetical protein